MDSTRKHEAGSDDLMLEGGGLCIGLKLGESIFLETDRGPVQVQVIKTRGDGMASLRIIGKAAVVRSCVLQRVLTNGTSVAETTERGRAIKSFVDSLVALFRAKQNGGK